MKKGKDLKPHIGIFGRRNNGKSAFINMITGQDVAIVSDHAGTTTDHVKKSVEIFGIGPAIIIDTAGIDDVGELGLKRVKKTREVIDKVDLAVLLISGNVFGDFEKDLIAEFSKRDTPYAVFHNKADLEALSEYIRHEVEKVSGSECLDISTITGASLKPVTNVIKARMPKTAYAKPSLLKGLVNPKDVVLLITPIDSEAPEGRMILPQVMAIRDVLDNHCICITVRETELEDFMKLGIKPALAITDSQAFGFVSEIIPEDVPLTGFSIVFARLKTNFDDYLQGTPKLSELQDGDKVLLLESCTHHVSCEDIGRFKLPKWIDAFTGKKITYDVVAGLDALENNIEEYALIIQCGGCVVTKKQLQNRLRPAIEANIAVSNYGMAIAYMNGVFERATKPFMQLQE